MPILAGLQIAAYALAAVAGLVNCPFYQDYLASQAEEEPPAVVETVEDAPELEEVAQDG